MKLTKEIEGEKRSEWSSPNYEQKYLDRFNSFFNSEKLSSTYKPVFLKSLLDISDYDDSN
ncbi:hypothetical protein [Candidatus Nitrosocosmicus sp. FF01]|uniref:hypothetical protein n=1 Tax=Candidatus Nitrosocosmicus sp. FF01 TaxID=3397670 RepID=UPI0039E76B26